MRRLHVARARIQGDRVRLAPEEWHYLRHVLRLAPGAPLAVFDGEGGEHRAELPAAGEELTLGPRSEVAPPAATVWLAFAPPRGERADWLVEKAVELGVARLAPFEAARSVVRLDRERGASRAARWRRIAAEAARQCGRAEVPAVDEPASLSAVLALGPPGVRRILFYEGGGEPLASLLDPAAPVTLALVGPEGGFAPEEIAEALAAGARLGSLGPRILRAETAAVAAAALLQHRLGDLG